MLAGGVLDTVLVGLPVVLARGEGMGGACLFDCAERMRPVIAAFRV